MSKHYIRSLTDLTSNESFCVFIITASCLVVVYLVHSSWIKLNLIAETKLLAVYSILFIGTAPEKGIIYGFKLNIHTYHFT